MSNSKELADAVYEALDEAKAWVEPLIDKLLDQDEEMGILLLRHNKQKEKRADLNSELGRWEMEMITQGPADLPFEECKRNHSQALEAYYKCQASISRTIADIEKVREKRERYQGLLSDAIDALQALNQEVRVKEEVDAELYPGAQWAKEEDGMWIKEEV